MTENVIKNNMKKEIILICMLIWLLLYPLAVTISETMSSYRRIMEKKEPYSDDTHAKSQLIHIVFYLLVFIGFLKLLLK